MGRKTEAAGTAANPRRGRKERETQVTVRDAGRPGLSGAVDQHDLADPSRTANSWERILFKCPLLEAKMGRFLGHLTNLKRFFTAEVTRSVSHS